MSDDTQIILNDERNSGLKNLFNKNKKSIIFLVIVALLLLIAYFFYSDFKKNNKIKISEKYSTAIISFDKSNPNKSINDMKNIIDFKDSTYSPLALYFLLDNNLLDNNEEINQYFDVLINQTNLEKEVKNLIIFKKGLYNSEQANEEELLNIFSPLINSENLWKSHSLYVLAEYFYAKKELQKSKEFFEKILEIENSNPQIKQEAQKRLRRDFGA